MARVPITVLGFRCERCTYEWIVLPESDDEPELCPKCKSRIWNRPRKNAPPMTYEVFRDTVRRILSKEKRPLTWTDVRMKARFPQSFPNNRWVRRMEADIGLVRDRDSHGILHWHLTSKEGTDDTRP